MEPGEKSESNLSINLVDGTPDDKATRVAKTSDDDSLSVEISDTSSSVEISDCSISDASISLDDALGQDDMGEEPSKPPAKEPEEPGAKAEKKKTKKAKPGDKKKVSRTRSGEKNKKPKPKRASEPRSGSWNRR